MTLINGLGYTARTISSILRIALTHSVAKVRAEDVTKDGCIILSFSVSTSAPYNLDY